MSDGKCPDIYDCRMGVDKIMRQNMKLQSRVRELEAEHAAEHQAAVDMFCKYDSLKEETLLLRKVVAAARDVVFGKSSDSIDADEYPELKRAIQELDRAGRGGE